MNSTKKMKEQMEKKMEKSYEKGWFGSVTIKNKKRKIESFKDIYNWLEDMCELAQDPSQQKHFFGLMKKSNEKGMLGLLNCCNQTNKTAFDLLGNPDYNSFMLPDLKEIKELLSNIEKAVKSAWCGRTKQVGFQETLKEAKAYIQNYLNNWKTVEESLENLWTTVKLPPVIKEKSVGAFIERLKDYYGFLKEKIEYQKKWERNYNTLVANIKKLNTILETQLKIESLTKENENIEELCKNVNFNLGFQSTTSFFESIFTIGQLCQGLRGIVETKILKKRKAGEDYFAIEKMNLEICNNLNELEKYIKKIRLAV